MKLVFMGTPEIARVCLEKLQTSGLPAAAVYTKPDTPQNRGMKLTQSAVKQYALSQGIPVYQPDTFRDDAAYEELKALAPDLIVVVAYGKILPQRVLDIPRLGCINMHASILPQLRGAAPVQRAILDHLDETGVTAMYLSAGMDEGDILEIRRTPIDPAETSGELMERLSVIAAELACDTVRAIEAGTAARTPAGQCEGHLRAHALEGALAHRLDGGAARGHRPRARAHPLARRDGGAGRRAF
jgi:methionyl-tRNA formyltransferase